MSGTLYRRTKICSLLLLTVVLKIVQRCDSGVVVSLRLNRFINPGGSCCNVRHGQCEPCYYEFQVCATRQSGYPYTSTGDLFCEYGRWNTGVMQSREDSGEDSGEGSSYLPSRFPSGHPNPLKFKVPYWEGRIRVTINVRDVGMWGYRNDPVIEYTFSLAEWRLGRTELQSFTHHWLFVRYGLRLDVQYAVYCQPDFYGRFCRGHCQPPTYYDQYTCDTNTGQKICHRGYTGYNCKQRISTSSYPWWKTTTRRPLPPRRLITTVAPTRSTSSSTTTITTPNVTTNTPASTTKSPTSTTLALISTTRPPFSTTETPTSTPQTPISTTDTLNPTTHTATSSTLKSTTHTLTSTVDTPSSTSHTFTSTTDTHTSTTQTPSITPTHMPTPTKRIITSTADTPTLTTDTISSTVDTPSSTSHNSTSATVTHTSTTSTPTYTPISSTKGTTQDANMTKIVASTAQTTLPQKLTTIGKEQATTAMRISNRNPATTQSPKPTPTEPASSTFGPSTLIAEYVITEGYSTNARTDANVTIPPHTQSSSAAYLKSLPTVFDQYVKTDTVSSETLTVSSSTEDSDMKSKSPSSPTRPSSPGEDVSTVPSQTTDHSSVTPDGGNKTDFLAHTSEETPTEVTTVGEYTTITASTLKTDSLSVSSVAITRRPTPKLSKKPTDHRRLKNETTTANPTSTGNPMSNMNVTNLTLPVSVSMVTGHAPTSSSSVPNQTDIYTNYSDIATQTTTPDSTDSETVGSTFPYHGTSTDGMFFTDSISQTSPQMEALHTVVTIQTATKPSPSPSTSPVVVTTVPTLNFTQARQPTGLQGNDHFPIRTMSPKLCWTWKSNDVKTICNCDQRDLPKLPPIDIYWGTSLRTGKPKFILGKVTLN